MFADSLVISFFKIHVHTFLLGSYFAVSKIPNSSFIYAGTAQIKDLLGVSLIYTMFISSLIMEFLSLAMFLLSPKYENDFCEQTNKQKGNLNKKGIKNKIRLKRAKYRLLDHKMEIPVKKENSHVFCISTKWLPLVNNNTTSPCTMTSQFGCPRNNIIFTDISSVPRQHFNTYVT